MRAANFTNLRFISQAPSLDQIPRSDLNNFRNKSALNMLPPPIDDHPFQGVPRNSIRLQCASETRPSLAIPKSNLPPPGILDMTFNRRSIDWSELQLFSPHSTCNVIPNPEPPSTDTPQPSVDLYRQLSNWNFPLQPSVPPRLVLWGPFNKAGQHPQFQQSAHSPQAYCPWPSSPLTPPSRRCKSPKRERDGHLPTACHPLATRAMPSKRPRTAEQDACKFPPTPRSAAYQIPAYPTPQTSPISLSSTFHNGHSAAEDPLSISPLSLSPRSFPQALPTDSKSLYLRDSSPAYPNFPYSQQQYSSTSTCHYAYYPNSPISPTTSLSLSPLSTNASPFPKSSNNGSHQLALQNPQYPNVWSAEWHQTFNQFRYQSQAH
ncbi:hypothetical protein PCANC_18954 [Puccinia coronata f. sp. avenae]|uniref:Uncharacterized protein n=1 Tax=Puccinia coronata f. sp. avenae TaxID=200324 RepID=A0A2N5ST39_9BASI|nr:hypothetical protein PCANC_18954 [Puccinia coronata f. sp. avenae]